jgi:hypothetical protein
MHVRRYRYLALLLPMLLCIAALAAAAGVAAPPAAAGTVSGNVTDQYGNPLGGILVEALDSVSGAPFASGTTETSDGSYYFADDNPQPASGMYKIRVSDPAGVFATTYLWGQSSFENAWVFACT